MADVVTQSNKGLFFSVKYTSTIDGTKYHPAVCYKLSNSLQKTIENMVAEGLARIYPAEVRFISGVAYPVKKQEAAPVVQPPTLPNPTVAVSGKPAAALKPAKSGGRKSGYAQQSGGNKEFS